MTGHEHEQDIIRKAREPEALQQLADEPDPSFVERVAVNVEACLLLGLIAIALGAAGREMGWW